MKNIHFSRPPTQELQWMERLLEPWRRWTRPLFFGLDQIPTERPLLFVGNHTIYGILDVPFLFFELLRERDIFVRALGHQFHFLLPGWRHFLARYGVVEGSRENCAGLMRAGECVLVFPGGGREVSKRRGERYKLLWGERHGFVKMAIQHQCTIVPFSSLGVEEMFDILIDGNMMLDSPLGGLLKHVNPELLMPISKGIGPTPIPKPERLYFQIGAPIPTSEFFGMDEDLEVCGKIRAEVRHAIERGIDSLQQFRDKDSERYLHLPF